MEGKKREKGKEEEEKRVNKKIHEYQKEFDAKEKKGEG